MNATEESRKEVPSTTSPTTGGTPATEGRQENFLVVQIKIPLARSKAYPTSHVKVGSKEDVRLSPGQAYALRAVWAGLLEAGVEVELPRGRTRASSTRADVVRFLLGQIYSEAKKSHWDLV